MFNWLLTTIEIQLLDSRVVPERLRGSAVSAMMRLCKSCKVYPPRLALHDIQYDNSSPLASGSYGDVYKGKLGKYHISLKLNRVHQRSARDVKDFIAVRSSILDCVPMCSYEV
jgi:hypothetical protein